MKFNLPKFEVPKVPTMHFGRGTSSAPTTGTNNAQEPGTSQPSQGASSTQQPSSTPGFGAKSKEQMSNFLRKTRRTLTPRSQQKSQMQKQQSEPPVGTELQKSSSDPHVVTNLKGILKGRKNKNKSSTSTSSSSRDVDMDPEGTPDDDARMFASTSELGSYTRGDYRQGDLKSMESGSRSTMGMAREHSQSSIIERMKVSDGYDTINRPPRPPPPKRFQRHKPKAKSGLRSTSEPPPAVDEGKEDNHSPPRPSRRKEPVGQRHLRVNKDIPYIEEGVPDAGGEEQQDSYPCPFIFETHDTFGDTEAFVEMLTNNILKDSWDSYKGEISPGSASAPGTLRKLPKSSQQTGVGASLIKALELQVEIEQKLNEDRKAREQRMKEIEQWQNELRNIKVPDTREIKQQLAASRESPCRMVSSQYYPSMTHSLDRASTRFRQIAEEFETPPESPTLPRKGATVTPRMKRRQVASQPPPVPQKRSATLPRKVDVQKPKAPERKKKQQGSRFSLPDYKIAAEISSAMENDSAGAKQINRPLPPPPMPPRTRHGGYATVKAVQPQQEAKKLRIEDIPPEIIQAIVEISTRVFMGNKASSNVTPAANNRDTIKELGEGLSVSELKVKKLSIEELSAVRIIVNNLAAKHVVADKASFGKIYSTTIKQDSMDTDVSHAADDRHHSLHAAGHGGHTSTEDISKTEDVSLATATYESARCETTTESSATSHTQFDTDLDCDSDLEGSIKSVEIAFDAIEETLQTFKETIASGPVVHSSSPNREMNSASPANMHSDA